MKKLSFALTALSLATSATFFSTSAFAEVSANVGVTNNYLWRGLEQTQGDAAVSGGLDYTSESGFYAGTWISNASWAEGMTYEIDLYGGYAGTINEAMSYDISYMYVGFPDEPSGDLDLSEVIGSFSYKNLTLGVAVLVTAEDFEAGDSVYASADYVLPLDNDVSLKFHVGSFSGDYSTESIDFGASVSKKGFTFGVSKTDFDDGVNSDDLKLYVSYTLGFEL